MQQFVIKKDQRVALFYLSRNLLRIGQFYYFATLNENGKDNKNYFDKRHLLSTFILNEKIGKIC